METEMRKTILFKRYIISSAAVSQNFYQNDIQMVEHWSIKKEFHLNISQVPSAIKLKIK